MVNDFRKVLFGILFSVLFIGSLMFGSVYANSTLSSETQSGKVNADNNIASAPTSENEGRANYNGVYPTELPPASESNDGWGQSTRSLSLPPVNTGQVKMQVGSWIAGLIILQISIVLFILWIILLGYFFVIRKDVQRAVRIKKWIKYLGFTLLVLLAVYLLLHIIVSGNI